MNYTYTMKVKITYCSYIELALVLNLVVGILSL